MKPFIDKKLEATPPVLDCMDWWISGGKGIYEKSINRWQEALGFIRQFSESPEDAWDTLAHDPRRRSIVAGYVCEFLMHKVAPDGYKVTPLYREISNRTPDATLSCLGIHIVTSLYNTSEISQNTNGECVIAGDNGIKLHSNGVLEGNCWVSGINLAKTIIAAYNDVIGTEVDLYKKLFNHFNIRANSVVILIALNVILGRHIIPRGEQKAPDFLKEEIPENQYRQILQQVQDTFVMQLGQAITG